MGQYYKPVMVENKNQLEWIYSHDIKEKWTRDDGKSFMMGQGLKLMEHSWMKNKLMRCVEGLMIPGGAWYKKPIAWAGDYAPAEEGTGHNLFDMADEGGEEGENISFKLIPKIGRAHV